MGARPGRRDPGFTLIEVLTVIVVLGVLAAIAIPALLHQRGRAYDTAVKHDLDVVAKAVVEAYTRTGTAPVVRVVTGSYQVDGEEIAPVSPGVRITGADPADVDTTGWTPTTWCLSLTHPDGSTGSFKFSAQAGLQPGACSSPTAP